MPVPAAPTSLRATRIGEGLRGVLDGSAAHRPGLRVLSVHRRVVNLVVNDGRLVAVADASVGGLPDGILVADAPDFATLRIRPGDVARWAEDELQIPTAGLAVRTDEAVEWSPRIAPRPTADWAPTSARAWTLADAVRIPGGVLDLPTARPALAALDAAIRAGDTVSAAGAAGRLIGLGPGLTPSGDDALAGIECALRAVGHPMAGFLGAALGDVEARTTTVSVALLRHAARGEAAERVHRLLDGLLGADPAALGPAIDAAIRYGATSGSDLLAGVLLGLDAATGVPATTGLPATTSLAAATIMPPAHDRVAA